ncbi:hypothetical protein [Microtetraspora sp. NBRC 16547]|uniref:hypothetical protein n=1 Tax=Microtetraspora sp. NBRC 16547 TaxID=3030993 RepID=UPI0024A1276F|nr:hypothetical protein [Microtetraspora sp. NBRC 16547]GLW99891.1 hypothetical protein Misp02_39780 [Microtetraspora sp. NBRC 16547]
MDAAAAFCEQHLGLRRAAVSPPHAVVFDTKPTPFAIRELLPGIDLADAARPGLGVALWFVRCPPNRGRTKVDGRQASPAEGRVI